jgi:sec-independent protein translocase protein TatA
MPNLGGPELIIVLLIFVLLFGAKKLPELGSSIGKGIKNFKRGIDEASNDSDDEDEQHVTTEGGSARRDQT